MGTKRIKISFRYHVFICIFVVIAVRRSRCVKFFYFTVKRGRNEISRRSLDSSVTIPHEATYRNLDQNRPADNSAAAESFNFCGCGWPQNMLIPKGNVEGLQCQIFVMVSNGSVDQVQIENCV